MGHVETRATAFSIYQTVFYVGIVVCSAVSGWLSGLGSGGWRWAFGLFGCGGNVLGALGPGLIGWLNGRLGMRASLASLAAFALVGAAVILVARFAWRRGRRAKADARRG